jgi:hypothetical protein
VPGIDVFFNRQYRDSLGSQDQSLPLPQMTPSPSISTSYSTSQVSAPVTMNVAGAGVTHSQSAKRPRRAQQTLRAFDAPTQRVIKYARLALANDMLLSVGWLYDHKSPLEKSNMKENLSMACNKVGHGM